MPGSSGVWLMRAGLARKGQYSRCRDARPGPAPALDLGQALRTLLPSAAMPKAALLLLLLCALLAGCGSRDGANARTPPTIALSECRLPPHDEAVLCGTLEVPENRDAPDGRKLAL